MTAKRSQSDHPSIYRTSLPDAVTTHLLLGDCRQRNGCDLCFIGEEGQRVLRMREARTTWNLYRDELKKTWREPFPCFAAYFFDRSKMPDLNDQEWTEDSPYHQVIVNAANLTLYLSTHSPQE